MQRILFALIAIAALATTAALADTYMVGDLKIEHPWARASAGAAAAGAAYMTITTTGATADRLVGASTPVAGKAELHTHIADGEVMRMRPVDAIEVEPGKPAVLKPGGLHVMLIGLKAPLKEGETFPLNLNFAKAGSVTVNVDVESAAAGAPDMGGHEMGGAGMGSDHMGGGQKQH